MSKVGASVGGQDRAALEAFVATGDTSVPGIEASDINDGDILARTQENVNPNGLFQFVYIPDDGSENVTSDWVDQEHKKKLTRQWVDGVKNAIIGRAQAKLQAARDGAEEARAKKIRDEQFAETVDVAEVVPVRVPTAVQTKPGIKSRQPMADATNADPSLYVEDQLDIARERLRAAEQAQQDITREVLTARRDYEKWKALASALSGVGDDSLRGEVAAGQTHILHSSGPVQQPARSSYGNARRVPQRGEHDDSSGGSILAGKSSDNRRG